MDAEFIRELFSEFGPVQVRRMFGGAGIFAGGAMVGLIADDVIYLKTDDAGSAAFAAENCAPFGYDTKGGRRVLTSYWRIPERLYDDPAELARWAQTALAAAQRVGRKPARAKRKARR